MKTRMSMRRVLAAMMAAALVVTADLAVQQNAALAAAGPSVPLPDARSTPVERQDMASRPADQAARNALTGNQPDRGSAPEGGGTPTATSLAPSSTWQVSAQSGDFSWSYPLRVPPAPGGLEPDLALSYASSAVDGRTSATNNQASWVGEGWDLAPGFVERVYGGCAEDADNGRGDLCWRSDNATASYPGGGGPLICCDGAGEWRAKSDDGSRIERLTGAGNGDNDGEYWKITRTDGTQYFFGSRPEAKSAWTVPVFGDDAGEPCHGGTFDSSHCVQAWRWVLDKVVDRHGNQILYTYEPEGNSYGMNLKDTAVPYVRSGLLRRIEYGVRDGQPATGRVEFTVADRCVPGSDCAPSKKDNWPDVPLDARCEAATCKDHYSPTFWSTKRLASVTAQVRGTDGAFTDVDSWTLDHQYPDPGDGEKAGLWLAGITHTGHVGGTAALPAVRFEGTKLPNRVYKVDGYAPLNRYRITGVVSESGGVLSVRYADPDCVAGSSMPAKPESNTLRCYPATWAKKDHAERTDHFHKYVVASVTQSDRLSTSSEQVTSYEYVDGAAWHHDTSEFTKDDKRTWNEFRGFGRVVVRTGQPGDPSGPIGKTEQRFYRGMHGDKLPSGTRSVTVQPSEGKARTDEDWLHGIPVESITYDGDTDRVVSKTIEEPSWQGPTATRGSLKAYLVRNGATQSYTALAAGGWRTTRTESTYDDRGLSTRTNDLGDTETAADDRCTRVWYARNTGKWLLSFPYRTETVGVDCGTEASFPKDAISDVRVAYDGQDLEAAPVTGNATRTETLSEAGAEGRKYVMTSTAKYDAHGRVVEGADALGRVSKTAYTPETGGPVTQLVTTNALGHTTTTTMQPAWGQVTAAVDANKRRTETSYDPLGRIVEVWQPSRPRVVDGVDYEGSMKVAYLIRNDAPSVVTTTSLGPNGNYVTSKAMYDGLLRPRQTQRPANGGGRLLTDTRYDSQGRAYRTTQSYFNDADPDDTLWVASDTEVPGLATTRFDGVGRTVAETFQSGGSERWRTTTAYGGDRVHVTPPAGGTASTTISDARGRTVELRQYHGDAPSGEHDTTRYAYTTAGRLASVTDPAGNTWRYGYDLRGNRVRVDDPDKGESTMEYDLAGQLVTATDARNVKLTYGHDLLGRRTSVKRGDTTLAGWSYDTAAKGKGRLASSVRHLDGVDYVRQVAGYTPLYQPTAVTVGIPEAEQTLSGSYTTHYSYNPDGSPSGVTLPALGDLPKETVSFEYDDRGAMRTMSGGLDEAGTARYVTGTEYTRYGELARLQLGDDGKRVWQSYYYEDSTRRLSRTILDAELPKPMQSDVHYTYDPSGNVLSVADIPKDGQADRQCFRYDHGRRLTHAWTPEGGCDADPAVGDLGGPARYWQSFSYDAVGNRLTETQHAASGDTVRRYAYSAAGAHDLTAVTTAGPAGTKTDEYAYDATGNTVKRPGQSLAWDAEGELAKVTEGDKVTEYSYDADGNRLIRRDPAARTLYLDGQELRLDATTGKKTATRYYRHGDATVAMRTGSGVTWLANDHQGTSQLAVDDTTQKVVRRRQAPFGAPRGTAATWPGEKGFVGGTIDASTGLTQLGARAYDAGTGRFISVDPIQDLTDPQQMHGYTYSNNNPVTFSDPTGLWFKDAFTKVAKVTKWLAPALSLAAVAVSVATPIGLAIAVAAVVTGAINAAYNCSGNGSWADCGSDILGAVPVVGKLVVGAAKTARTAADMMRYSQGLAKHQPRALGTVTKAHADRQIAGLAAGQGQLGHTPTQWMLGANTAGRTGTIVDETALAVGTWHHVRCDWAELAACPDPPAGDQAPAARVQPTRYVPWNFIGPFQPGFARAPRPAVSHNFIGPISRDTVRLPAPAAPAVPAPAPVDPGRNYTTKDGRLCNTRGGNCAI
ncbi:RHS repeat-associated core domain-containing protein [Actinoplanes sp. ATCC 53533]|uniref:RHS repeat-associated core domain-containing protein n=1 Tax=Actinoplanes sp. ATCC 53533 TaxID=1288362 RepID=UPI0018F46303|nr:RHS repeat-associated core domain-containing protein [Actinoplanes sp. ATCC 53533]